MEGQQNLRNEPHGRMGNQPLEGERGVYPAQAREEKPPTFRGATGEDVDAWIEEYEQVAAFNRWPDAEKRSSVILYLQKTAKDWYHSRVRAVQWPELGLWGTWTDEYGNRLLTRLLTCIRKVVDTYSIPTKFKTKENR